MGSMSKRREIDDGASSDSDSESMGGINLVLILVGFVSLFFVAKVDYRSLLLFLASTMVRLLNARFTGGSEKGCHLPSGRTQAGSLHCSLTISSRSSVDLSCSAVSSTNIAVFARFKTSSRVPLMLRCKSRGFRSTYTSLAFPVVIGRARSSTNMAASLTSRLLLKRSQNCSPT